MLVDLTKEELLDIRKLLHKQIMSQPMGVYTKWNQLAMKVDEYLEGKQ